MRSIWLLACSLCLLLSSCVGNLASTPSTPSTPSVPSDNLGVTPGGVQDMQLARELVSNGKVPPAAAFTVEGMYSEHDLPLTASKKCAQLFCVTSALAIAPDMDGKTSGWLQLGFSSNAKAEDFTLEPLSLIFVVDVSGSMNRSYKTIYNDYQTPLKVAKNLMAGFSKAVRPVDEVAIVSYGSNARTQLDFTSDVEKIQSTITDLRTEGATNMEAGLQLAYQVASKAKNSNSRIILFSDVQPNIGASNKSQFQNLMGEAALGGTGTTVVGVGIGLGAKLFKAVGEVRGGNAFSIFSSKDVSRVLEQDWPFFTQAVAYDFKVDVNATNVGTQLVRGYGFPVDAESDAKEAKLETSTLFLSRRKGAQLIQFHFDSPSAIENFATLVNLSYQTPDSKAQTDTLINQYDKTELKNGYYFQQKSVEKTVALGLLVANMHKAADLYGKDQTAALKLMEKSYSRFDEDVKRLGDASLNKEVLFAASVLELMRKNAPQGTLY